MDCDGKNTAQKQNDKWIWWTCDGMGCMAVSRAGKLAFIEGNHEY